MGELRKQLKINYGTKRIIYL